MYHIPKASNSSPYPSHMMPTALQGPDKMTETEIVTAKEDKAKVVAAVWGERIYSIPCRTSYFSQDDFEE